MSHNFVAAELAACIAEARPPTLQELGRMAQRIGHELHGSRSAFAWGRRADDDGAKWIPYRLAQAALMGMDEGEGADAAKPGSTVAHANADMRV